MKIAVIWKWWSWKTFISVVLINLLSKYRKIIAIDADSNKNLIDYIFPNIPESMWELGDYKADIFKMTWSSDSEYTRKYAPKDDIWVLHTSKDDEIYKKVAYMWDNIDLIQLWEPRSARIWVTWMCPYNETIKVYMSNLAEKDDEIVFVDFPAWSEVAGKGIVASFDNILIPIEANFKNLDVAKDIHKTLKLIGFNNVHFILNKIRSEKDIELIKDYFSETINIIWQIPFSKDIMRMDMKRDININDELRAYFDPIVESILSFSSNDSEVLERLKTLDELKWSKKVH